MSRPFTQLSAFSSLRSPHASQSQCSSVHTVRALPRLQKRDACFRVQYAVQ